VRVYDEVKGGNPVPPFFLFLFFSSSLPSPTADAFPALKKVRTQIQGRSSPPPPPGPCSFFFFFLFRASALAKATVEVGGGGERPKFRSSRSWYSTQNSAPSPLFSFFFSFLFFLPPLVGLAAARTTKTAMIYGNSFRAIKHLPKFPFPSSLFFFPLCPRSRSPSDGASDGVEVRHKKVFFRIKVLGRAIESPFPSLLFFARTVVEKIERN